MSEPKGLREILESHMARHIIHDSEGALEDDLIAWAKAYGEQVREACAEKTIGSERLAIERMPLPEPKP